MLGVLKGVAVSIVLLLSPPLLHTVRADMDLDDIYNLQGLLSTVIPSRMQTAVSSKDVAFRWERPYNPPPNNTWNDVEKEKPYDHFTEASNRLQRWFKQLEDYVDVISNRLKDGLRREWPHNVVLCDDTGPTNWGEACLWTERPGGRATNPAITSAILANLPPRTTADKPPKEQGISTAFVSLEGDTIIWPRAPIHRHNQDAAKQFMNGTLVARPKDIVIVVDTSEVMAQQATSTYTKKNLATIAIVALLETLSTKDRVAVMTFPEDRPSNSPCTGEKLGFVTSQVKHDLEVDFRLRLRPGKMDYTQHQLYKAFNIFKSSEEFIPETQREKIVLFFMGQSYLNGSLHESIKNTFITGRQGLQQPVKVIGVTVGSPDEGNVQDLMGDLSSPHDLHHIFLESAVRHDFVVRFHEPFMRVTSPIYTNSLSPYNVSVVHTCKTVHMITEDRVVGLVCVLVPRAFIERVVNITCSDGSYSFLLDRNGQLIYHPYVDPYTWSGIKVRLENLEQPADLMTRILREPSGTHTVHNKKMVRRYGRHVRDGFHVNEKTVTYIWTRLDNSSLSFCLVMVEDDKMIFINPQPSRGYNSQTFPYHRKDLAPSSQRPPDCCCNNQDAFCNNVSLVLAPAAFNSPRGPLCAAESKTQVRDIINFITGRLHSYYLQTQAREVVRLLHTMKELMDVTVDADFNRLYKFYIAGFLTGVFIIYPGVQVHQPDYDHTRQDWYMAAAASLPATSLPGDTQLIFSPAKYDRFDPHREPVITISQAVTVQLPQRRHLFGVQAVEVSLERFRNLTSIYIKDHLKNTFFITKAGYLVYHPTFLEEDRPANIEHVHVMERERRVSDILKDNGVLVTKHCIEGASGRRRKLWEVEMRGQLKQCVTVKDGHICVYHLQHTNLYIVEVNGDGYLSSHGLPIDEESEIVADTCSGLFKNSYSDPLCPPDLWEPGVNSVEPEKDEECAHNKTCGLFNIDCSYFTNDQRQCEGFAYEGCLWCDDDSTLSESCEPKYCPYTPTSTVETSVLTDTDIPSSGTVKLLTTFLSVAVVLVVVLMCILISMYLYQRCRGRPLSVRDPGPDLGPDPDPDPDQGVQLQAADHPARQPPRPANDQPPPDLPPRNSRISLSSVSSHAHILPRPRKTSTVSSQTTDDLNSGYSRVADRRSHYDTDLDSNMSSLSGVFLLPNDRQSVSSIYPAPSTVSDSPSTSRSDPWGDHAPPGASPHPAPPSCPPSTRQSHPSWRYPPLHRPPSDPSAEFYKPDSCTMTDDGGSLNTEPTHYYPSSSSTTSDAYRINDGIRERQTRGGHWVPEPVILPDAPRPNPALDAMMEMSADGGFDNQGFTFV